MAGPAHDFWAQGDYHRVVGQYLTPVAVGVVRAARPDRGVRLLDVGCGTGNAALAAARYAADVTALDISPGLLRIATERAKGAGLPLTPVLGNAAALPFADDTFDATVSVFAHVFAPDGIRATRELVRVTHPGGHIGFTAWREDGGSGAMMSASAKWIPGATPEQVKAGLRFADGRFVASLLADEIATLRHRTGQVAFVTPSVERFYEDHARASPGMIGLLRPFQDDPERLAGIRHDIIEALRPYHRDGALHLAYKHIQMQKR